MSNVRLKNEDLLLDGKRITHIRTKRPLWDGSCIVLKTKSNMVYSLPVKLLDQWLKGCTFKYTFNKFGRVIIAINPSVSPLKSNISLSEVGGSVNPGVSETA